MHWKGDQDGNDLLDERIFDLPLAQYNEPDANAKPLCDSFSHKAAAASP